MNSTYSNISFDEIIDAVFVSWTITKLIEIIKMSIGLH